MEEKEYVTHLLWEWSEARSAANENTDLMVKSNFSQTVMEECAHRMKRLQYCEEEMLELSNVIPQELKNFIDARHDKGCSYCWLSSIRSSQHRDCARKIARYFQTEKDLYFY